MNKLEIIIDRKILLKAMRSFTSVMNDGEKETHTLSRLFFYIDDNNLSIYGSGTTTSFIDKVPFIEIQKQGETLDYFYTHFKDMLKALTSAKEKEIKIVIEENKRVVLKNVSREEHTLTYACLKLDETESTVSSTKDNYLKILDSKLYSTFNKDKILDMLNKISHVISKNLSRYSYEGLYMKWEEDNFVFSGTNGKSIVVYKIPQKDIVINETKIDLVNGIIVPIDAIVLLEVYLKKDKENAEVEILLEEGSIYFKVGNLIIKSELMETSYPDYKHVLSEFETAEYEVVFNREEFIGAIKEANRHTTKYTDYISFDLKEKESVIYIRSFEKILNVKYKSEKAICHINVLPDIILKLLEKSVCSENPTMKIKRTPQGIGLVKIVDDADPYDKDVAFILHRA